MDGLISLRAKIIEVDEEMFKLTKVAIAVIGWSFCTTQVVCGAARHIEIRFLLFDLLRGYHSAVSVFHVGICGSI